MRPLLMGEGAAAVWTEEDDEEMDYGKWYEYDAKAALAEEYKVHPPKETEDIWPHWSEGVPTKLRIKVYSPSFFVGDTYHRPREYYETVEVNWNAPHQLSFLARHKQFLPRTYRSDWSGVYRIFSRNTPIDRCCGQDPTGTLYIGLAGSRGRNWSILRTRIGSILTREHHAIRNSSELSHQKFPWESLLAEWAYTGEKSNYKGEPIAEAVQAEKWLLACYNDSFGEYPPWNQRG
jgi:hypothetical protein